MENTSIPPPEVGQAVRVRNRLATVRAVEPYDTRTAQGRLNIVEVEYLDNFRYPEAEQLLWEVESTAFVLGKTSLPGVDAHPPDNPGVLQSFINAHRWTRLNRLREGDGIERRTAARCLEFSDSGSRRTSWSRSSSALADAPCQPCCWRMAWAWARPSRPGWSSKKPLLRRRIRRILVLCPAMLQRQWKYELRCKFSLDFEVIDSDSTFQLRRRLGIDTNPWKAFPRIITSMDYLRMPDVLGQFLQVSGAGPDAETNGGQVAAHAPWDLLIVDECHHFAPQGGRPGQPAYPDAAGNPLPV